MSAQPEQIGNYPVEREVGRGGMGVVYLGRDPRLNRRVAIKVLPEALARDPDRLARFEREARLLASLHHPNIAGIYGLEEAGGVRFLTLEYVEGDTLAQRLARGALPVDEALEVCRQIAAALEAAHESGVIHRDLKPGNVKISPTGEVKVLDFGLAKGSTSSGIDSNPSLLESPTLTMTAGTGVGVILGTAAYMSPEQARGKVLDRRTDIWSFGCVLYECLTGRMTFPGETVSDTIAKILEREPDWSALPPQTPARARELLRRCLDKDAKKRLRDIGDARIELEEALNDIQSSSRLAAAAAEEKKRSRGAAPRLTAPVVAVGLVVGAILGVLLWNTLGPGAGLARKAKAFSLATHLSIALPHEIRFAFTAISPDGSMLICIGRPRGKGEGGEEPEPSLYTRRLDSFDATPLAGTEGARAFLPTKDGRYVFFVQPASKGSAKNKLVKVPLDGSAPPIVLTDWKDNWAGVAALYSGDILVVQDQGQSFVRIPGGGGDPSSPIKIDAGAFRGRFLPTDALPGDKGILLNAIAYGSRGWYYRIAILDPKTGKVRFLLDDGGNAQYAPTGHLLFSRGDVLLAAPFDLGREKISGPATPILRGLLTFYTVQPGNFALASNGTLTHRPGGEVLSARQLVYMDPDGVVKPWSAEQRPYAGDPVISRDGSRFAVTISNAQGIDECWVSEVAHPALRRVVGLPDADCDVGAMSPDGQWLAYRRNGRDEKDGIYLERSDGQSEAKLALKDPSPNEGVFPASWAPDGSALLIHDVVGGRFHLKALPLSEASGVATSPKPLISGFVDEYDGTFSPDGKMIAFTSNESGKSEVYVCAYHADGTASDPVRVSAGGGHTPHWLPGGRSLVYVSDPSRLMSVSIGSGPEIAAGTPVQSVNLDQVLVSNLSVLPSGRMLCIQTSDLERGDVTSVNVVLDLFDELKKKSRK